MPFPQDADFVGRSDVLLQIEQGFKDFRTLRRIVLVGLGGIGFDHLDYKYAVADAYRKSQIAIEYAWQQRRKNPFLSLFWVSATTPARFVQCFESIASTVGIPGAEDPKADILKLTADWLQNAASGPWLMILDNADNSEDFFDQRQRFLAKGTSESAIKTHVLSNYLPQVGNGSILITSRDEATGHRLCGQRKQIIHLDSMPTEDNLALLSQKLEDDPTDIVQKEELIVELGHLPLAIAQAAAYIVTKRPKMTIFRYLEIFRQSERNQILLLSRNEADLRRDPTVPNSVIKTWEISFTQIKDQCPLATQILFRICCLDRQGVPEFMLKFETEGHELLEVEEAMGFLISYSLIKYHEGTRMYSVHRLVQLATQSWMEDHGSTEEILMKVLDLFEREYPEGSFNHWELCQAFEPHMQAIVQHKSHLALRRQLVCHFRRCLYLSLRGRHSELSNFLRQILEFQEGQTTSNLVWVVHFRNLLAQSLFDQDSDDECERTSLETLAKYGGVVKLDNFLLSTKLKLARLYRRQRRIDEAIRLQTEIMDSRKKSLGPVHSETLDSISELSESYLDCQRVEEAERLALLVFETRRRILGLENEETMTAWTKLIAIHLRKGDLEGAESLMSLKLQIEIKVYGPEHLWVAQGMRTLAEILWKLGRRPQAVDSLKKSIEIYDKAIGREEKHTVNARELLETWLRSPEMQNESATTELVNLDDSESETIRMPEDK